MLHWFKRIKIPKGEYCYTIKKIMKNQQDGRPQIKIKTCPFWRIDKNQPEQMNGYCDFLKKGDWEENGTFLLWDQVKECGIKHYTEKEMEKMFLDIKE